MMLTCQICAFQDLVTRATCVRGVCSMEMGGNNRRELFIQNSRWHKLFRLACFWGCGWSLAKCHTYQYFHKALKGWRRFDFLLPRPWDFWGCIFACDQTCMTARLQSQDNMWTRRVGRVYNHRVQRKHTHPRALQLTALLLSSSYKDVHLLYE